MGSTHYITPSLPVGLRTKPRQLYRPVLTRVPKWAEHNQPISQEPGAAALSPAGQTGPRESVLYYTLPNHQ